MAYAHNSKVLNGRASVVSYTKAPEKFYLRQLIKGTTKYQTRLIQGASTPEQAEERALDVLLELGAQPVERIKTRFTEEKVVDRRGKVRDINRCIEEYVSRMYLNAESGLLDEKTAYGKEKTYKNLKKYLAHKGVWKTSQVSSNTFEDYPLWRRKADGSLLKQGAIKTELGHISDFVVNYLSKHRLIDKELEANKLVPYVKTPEPGANPPLITPGNWNKVLRGLDKNVVRAQTTNRNHRATYFAKLFRRFIIIARNCGLRPDVELCKLRWCDVQRENVGRWSKTEERTKDKWIANITVVTGKRKRNGMSSKRTVPCNGVDEQLKKWKQEQQDYIDKYCPGVVITPETLIFGNPFNEMKQYTYSQFRRSWRMMRETLDLTPYPLAPDEKYTIYSMRSTYICNLVLQDKDIYITAKLAGNTVAVCERFYAQLDMLQMSKKITDFEFGKRGRRTSTTTTYI